MKKRVELSGNTNNQVFTVRVYYYRLKWAFTSNLKLTVLKPGWGKSLLSQKIWASTRHPVSHPNISRGGTHDKDLRTYMITAVYFHQKSVIYFCQGRMVSKGCYAWISCFKRGLDPVYLSKFIKLILSIISL